MVVDSLVRHLKLTRGRSISSVTSDEVEDIEEEEDFVELDEPYRAPAYPYRLLGESEVRLLRIVPGTDTIECVLHQMPLAEVDYFYALSYVWGDTRQQKTIILEGRPFHITYNLHEALHRFRERPPETGYPNDYFWVDSICINQDDLEEKSCHIPRMMDIYNKGFIIIWLGHPKEQPADGLLKSYIRRVRSNPPEISQSKATRILFKKAETMWIDWEPVDEDDNVILHSKFGHDYGAIVKATANILHHPWFNRVWTIQEASTSRWTTTIYVGRHSVTLRKFIQICKCLAMEYRPLFYCSGSTRIVALYSIEALYTSAQHDCEDNPKNISMAEVFLKLLNFTGKKNSTDPRDQIYGLLSLLKDLKGEDLPEALEPDYRLSYEEVYWRCAAFLFQSVGDLKLLDCGRNEIQGNVPSWVPDFRYLTHKHTIRREESVRVSPNRLVLHVRGRILATFRSFINGCVLTHIWPKQKIIPIALPLRLREFGEQILKPSASIRGISLEAAFDDNIAKVLMKIIPSHDDESFYQVYRRLSNSSGGRRSWYYQKKRTTNIRLKEEAIADSVSCPFLLLTDGSVVKVNREDAVVRPGDLVCIFKGASKPSLIRASGEQYRFLSHCRVESGSLEGNEFENDFWDDTDIEDFELI